VRALKAHSGKFKIVAGKPLPAELLAENPDDVRAGAANLIKQIENVKVHGVSPVVAINAFPGDFASEHAAIREIAESVGARVAVCTHFSDGGKGATDLAQAVVEACDEPSTFAFCYPLEATLKEKIESVATKIYGAANVTYTNVANTQLARYEKNGFGNLPVCIAKTHLSISGDATLKGAPIGHTLNVREVRASVGAGFVYPICGDMTTMPGLGSAPAASIIDFDDNGEIVGLS
jgi:formate--tetrahydrofolate ligase